MWMKPQARHGNEMNTRRFPTHRDPPKALKARPWIAKGEIHEVDGTLERRC
jgi:hypothetical protein